MAASFDTTLQQVRSARAGDQDAMQALFRRYLPWVVETVALRLGRRRRDCGDLDDIAQESLLDAFRSLDRFEHRTEGSFRLWLARIVENNVIDAERRRLAQKRGRGEVRQLSVTEADRARGNDATPSQIAGQREDGALVERALLELPPRAREILVLRDRCDLSFEEVAQAAGLGSAESARTTYRRALQAFAAVLQGLQQP
jgi:RNA polymerase sigma-70 factor, ECF subfamily